MPQTLSKPFRYEQEIKKSRFIANAGHAASAAHAMQFIESISEPQASHNCWAYQVGCRYRFSDDGEPGGTAGRPILGAIQKQGLDRVVVVVTRYFGGIKLGAGGLARAYLGTAAECLRCAAKREIKNYVTVEFKADFDATGGVHTVIERLGAAMVNENYSESGINAQIQVEANLVEHLEAALLQATRGKGIFTIQSPARATSKRAGK